MKLLYQIKEKFSDYFIDIHDDGYLYINDKKTPILWQYKPVSNISYQMRCEIEKAFIMAVCKEINKILGNKNEL